MAPGNSAGRIVAPFGEANRNKLISRFLAESDHTPWKTAYRLLLWTDKTTGLAHCYESDKCQPGKNWHQRNLRFHDWLAGSLGSTPSQVGEEIDWLFRHVAEDYAHAMVDGYKKLLQKAGQQRAPFQGRGFPEPGEDPAIVGIIREVLGAHLTSEPNQDQWREMTRRVRELIAVENKRKNIVGEGFEDVLAAIIRRADTSSVLEVQPRRVLPEIQGFANTRQGDKRNKVDLAIVRASDGRRMLVTAKWSIRADREKQFPAEFTSYVNAESANQTFDYVLLTNEFDPARLARACEINAANNRMITTVVHISPPAVRAVYGDKPEGTMERVLKFIDEGRIVALDQWIDQILV